MRRHRGGCGWGRLGCFFFIFMTRKVRLCLKILVNKARQVSLESVRGNAQACYLRATSPILACTRCLHTTGDWFATTTPRRLQGRELFATHCWPLFVSDIRHVLVGGLGITLLIVSDGLRITHVHRRRIRHRRFRNHHAIKGLRPAGRWGPVDISSSDSDAGSSGLVSASTSKVFITGVSPGMLLKHFKKRSPEGTI